MRPSWKQSGRKAMNIANWLQAQALQAPESPALYTGSECRATYHEFAARAAALSGVFVRDYGLRAGDRIALRSEEHTSELQSLMRISYAVFCLKKKKNKN